jgi:hypothetical protein
MPIRADREYRYRPKWGNIFLSLILFTSLGGYGAWAAATDTRGMIINHVIELDPAEATAFRWVMAVACLLGVPLSVAAAVHRLCMNQRVVLSEAAVILPASPWSGEERLVPYAEIEQLRLLVQNTQAYLEVKYRGGKFTIAAAMLEEPRDFDEISGHLRQAIGGLGPAS